MGRRKILNEEQKAEIVKLLAQNHTSKEIALKYGVSKNTVDRLRRTDEIKDKVRGLTLDEIREILETKFRVGSVQDRELYLKYIQKWNPTAKVKVEGDITINADEAAQAVLSALKKNV